jgi:hypothetical protein
MNKNSQLPFVVKPVLTDRVVGGDLTGDVPVGGDTKEGEIDGGETEGDGVGVGEDMEGVCVGVGVEDGDVVSVGCEPICEKVKSYSSEH